MVYCECTMVHSQCTMVYAKLSFDIQLNVLYDTMSTALDILFTGEHFRCGPCPEGYEGDGTAEGCQRVTPSCADQPCFTGVACIDLTGGRGFRCGECPAEYTGDGTKYGCRLLTCRDTPCFSGVRCTDQGGRFR